MTKRKCKGSRLRQYIDSRRGKPESWQGTTTDLLRSNPIQWAKLVPIYWKHKTPTTTERVIAQGCKHDNKRYNDDSHPSKMQNIDEITLHRWAVNFLRHECLPYNKLQRLPKGKKAKRIIRWRCFEMIAERFPELKAECERQANKDWI